MLFASLAMSGGFDAGLAGDLSALVESQCPPGQSLLAEAAGSAGPPGTGAREMGKSPGCLPGVGETPQLQSPCPVESRDQSLPVQATLIKPKHGGLGSHKQRDKLTPACAQVALEGA